MSPPTTPLEHKSSSPCIDSSPVMPYGRFMWRAAQDEQNTAHFGARAATEPVRANGMTNLDDIPLMTLIAVEDRPMAGPEIYDALTSHACAIVGAAAGDASAEVAADRDNVEAGADVHDGEANALSVDVVDEKDNIFAVADEEPADNAMCSHAPKDIPLDIYKPDLPLHMMSLSADDLVSACGHISRLEEVVLKALRGVNLEVPNVQHTLGTGIGQLYGERDILVRFLKRRDVGRLSIRALTALEVKVRILQRQTNRLLADVKLLVLNIDTARTLSGGVVRRAKRDHKYQVSGPY